MSETGQAVMKDIEKVASDTQRIVEEKIQPALREAEHKGIMVYGSVLKVSGGVER